MKVAALRTAPPIIIASVAIVCICVYTISSLMCDYILSGSVFWSLRYFFRAMLPAMTAVNLT